MPVRSTRDRRSFLAALLALGASACADAAPLVGAAAENLMPRSRGNRVVIVGGGWGGLTAARELRARAPEFEVVLLERNAAFWSGALSNKWLAGQVDTRLMVHDYAATAARFGYRFIRADVLDVDRAARRIVTASGSLDYDWLVLGVGIRYDYASWFGDDRRATEQAREQFPCAYLPGDETVRLKRKLENFAGGDLVMNLPPMPYRCPPSPYERAAMIGWMLKTRKIKGRLIVLDPNPISPVFRRIYTERYRDQIHYVDGATVKRVDPFKRSVSTEFDDYAFDDAILMPPQQAGDLLWKMDLIGRDSGGSPTGWAAQDPVHLHAVGDERVFLVGDALGPVSPLFGHYPKSGHLASRQGRIAAQEIVARARGAEPPKLLPDSVCFVFSDFEPQEMVRIDSVYRFRGDGLIQQTVRQVADPNPRNEDVDWAKAMFADFLGA
jgi:NADPH-dependent 2,4-dienoyl-CoA reductase/sulfur reductase-like enzyme